MSRDLLHLRFDIQHNAAQTRFQGKALFSYSFVLRDSKKSDRKENRSGDPQSLEGSSWLTGSACNFAAFCACSSLEAWNKELIRRYIVWVLSDRVLCFAIALRVQNALSIEYQNNYWNYQNNLVEERKEMR